jgi:hypothetical protein
MSGARPVHANKAAKPEAASGQSMQALSPMPVAILPQAAQTPGIANPIEQNFTAEKAESSQAALSQTALPIDTSSAFAAASLAPHPSNPSSSEEVAGAANGAIQKTAKGSEGPAKTEQPSADSTLSEPSSGRINSIESAGAQQAPLPSAAELGEGEELLKPAAPRGNPIEPPARGASANQTQTLVPSQRSAQLSLPEQGSAPVALPSDYSTPVFAPGYERISSQAENLVLKAAPVAAASDGLAQPSMTPNAVAQSGQLAVVSSAVASSGVGKANTVVAEKISTLSRVHSERGTGGVDGIRHGNGLMPAASSSPIGDASAVTRDVAAGRGAVNTIASTGAATGPDSREAFATLDGEGALARPSWIHAGREQAEAGFQDPSLGWVGVRADASGGGVHAEVVAGSADAAQALGSHMAGLNAYLAEHHTPVETLTLSGPEGGWTGSKSDTGGDMQQGAGQDRAQGGDAGVSAGSTQSASGSTTAQEAPAQLAGIDASAQFSRPGGAHISVMA